MDIRLPQFTPEEAKAHSMRYAYVVQNIIDRCKFERKALLWDCDDVTDAYADNFFYAVWRSSSAFPAGYDQTYQAAMYIGYLRGKSDMLDIVGRIINQELKETHAPVDEYFKDEAAK